MDRDVSHLIWMLVAIFFITFSSIQTARIDNPKRSVPVRDYWAGKDTSVFTHVYIGGKLEGVYGYKIDMYLSDLADGAVELKYYDPETGEEIKNERK